MKKICVPVDFSQHSRSALEVAYELAVRNKLALNIFHVIESPKTSSLLPDLYLDTVPDDTNFNESLIKLAKEKIQKWVTGRSDNVGISIYASVGNLSDEFKKYTRENPPDLMVMGARGYNKKHLNTIGDFTERMIRKSDFPVLIVKAGYAKKEVNKTMMVADFIENEANIAFEIKRLNRLFNAHIEILRINTPQDFESDSVIESKFQLFLDKYLLENCSLFIYNHAYKEEGIVLAAKKSKADLIAIAAYSKNILERLFSIPNENSLEEEFIDLLEYPVWVFKPYFKFPSGPGLVDEIREFKFFSRSGNE